VELRHLRYFVTVAELGNLAQAARRLNVAQSALSRQIQDLERELGAPLLERLPRGMQATAAGRAFLEHARRALAEAHAGAHAVSQIAAGAAGELRIGTVDWGLHVGRIGEGIACLRARHPAATVTFDPTAWTEQPAAVAAGRVDAGFCPAVHATDLPPTLLAEALAEGAGGLRGDRGHPPARVAPHGDAARPRRPPDAAPRTRRLPGDVRPLRGGAAPRRGRAAV
jgi:DNA-binding transcriptional LysR family regulator